MNRSPWRLEEVDGSPWRLEEVDGADEQYPVESVLRYATPLPINRTPVSTVGGSFPPFCGMPGLVSIASSVQALPMNTTTHSVPTYEHDDDVVSLFRPSHVHEPWPYVCASRRSRPRPYVRTWSYFLACGCMYVYTV